MAHAPDPSPISSKQALEAENVSKERERKHTRMTAMLTAGIGLLGALLTGALALLGSYIQAVHKSSDTVKLEISQKTDLNPLKGLFDGIGAVLHAAATGSLAPDVKPTLQTTPIQPQPGPPPNGALPSIESGAIPVADGECSTGSKDWAFIPEPALPQRNGDSSSYTIDFRLSNKASTDAFFTYVDQPSLTDNAANKLNVVPSIPGGRLGPDGIKVAAGEESNFSVSSYATKTQLGDHIRSFNINLFVTPVDAQQSSKKGDTLAVGCRDIPVRQLAGATSGGNPAK